MSLSRCTECETIEGTWLQADEEDVIENPELEVGDYICGECGSTNCHQGIPEHDDYDMER